MATNAKITDTIPRAGVHHILDGLVFVQNAGGKSTFEQVRAFIKSKSRRLAPASRFAMWTVARDILSDLQRLEYATVGPLPRLQSAVADYLNTPVELTSKGAELAAVYLDKSARGYDALLLAWLSYHPYFRIFTARLQRATVFVPDITSIKQVGQESLVAGKADELTKSIIRACIPRLTQSGVSAERIETFSTTVTERVRELQQKHALNDLDSKRWIDAIQDKIVMPAFLAEEDFPFDGVTFTRLLGASQEFLTAASTTSHPDLPLRVVFPTCKFRPIPQEGESMAINEVIHHGKAFASEGFVSALTTAYRNVAKSGTPYVSAYVLRAAVCFQMKIQPLVFSACLKQVIDAPPTGLKIWTELPFDPPPSGENHVIVGRNRIGLIKLTFGD